MTDAPFWNDGLGSEWIETAPFKHPVGFHKPVPPKTTTLRLRRIRWKYGVPPRAVLATHTALMEKRVPFKVTGFRLDGDLVTTLKGDRSSA